MNLKPELAVQDAKERAERKEEAAAMAERERAKVAAMAEEAEARRRAADRNKHREKINAEVVSALFSLGVRSDWAEEIVRAVADGKINHMTVNY